MTENSRPAPAFAKLKFGEADAFTLELRKRVDEYFSSRGLSKRDCPRMYLKTAVILAWCAASYVGLVFFAGTWLSALPLAVSLGLATAAIGFNIQHDGGHQAYSDRGWVNKLMALNLDMLGGSSYVWAWKHNSIHHSYTNVADHDDDINLSPVGRVSPHQKRLGFHRFQHFYLWVLYGFLSVKWQVYDDYSNVILGKVGKHRMARPRGWDLVQFVAGKILFVTLAFVVPLRFHSIGAVLLYFAAASFVQGVVLSVVFQLAHCVEEANFPLPKSGTGHIDSPWAVHQIETTVDFGRKNRLLTWYAGGLNFQTEHHLFPQICHLHYPAISEIVEETCARHRVKYAAHPTLSGALSSHYRWLRRMGVESEPRSNRILENVA